MKVVPVLNSPPKNTTEFLNSYLTACGVEDVKTYLNPTEDVLDNMSLYGHFLRAFDLFSYMTAHAKKIGVIVDCDCDGYCSSAIIINFLDSIGVKVDNIFLHEGKQHGIKDLIDQIYDSGVDTLIVPDAGCDDAETLIELELHGVKVLILDHHNIPNGLVEKINKETFDVAIINPNNFLVSEKRPDNRICGTAVTWLFIREFCSISEIELPNYLDLVAVATITDMMDLASLSNRYFVKNGLTKNPTNPLIKLLFEKKLRRGLNSQGIGWDIGPLFNAVCRSNDMEAKRLIIEVMIGKADPQDALKAMVRLHNRQSKEVARIQEQLEPGMNTNHKVNVAFGEVSDATYLGLCANKLMSAYNKPTFVLRELNENTWVGSLRSPIPIAGIINQSGKAEAMGHDEAAGIFVGKDALDDLLGYLDNNLDASIEPSTSVTLCIEPKKLTNRLAGFIKNHEQLWGHGIPSPTFYISAKCNPNNIAVFEKKTVTIKFTIDDVDFLKFRATPEEVLMAKSAMIGKSRIPVQMIVTPDLNEWGGIIKAQGIIEKLQFQVNSDDCIVEEDIDELF